MNIKKRAENAPDLAGKLEKESIEHLEKKHTSAFIRLAVISLNLEKKHPSLFIPQPHRQFREFYSTNSSILKNQYFKYLIVI